MATLRFTDGEQFDTSGEYRTEQRKSGWYVLGGGLMVAVASKQEGEDYLAGVKAGLGFASKELSRVINKRGGGLKHGKRNK